MRPGTEGREKELFLFLLLFLFFLLFLLFRKSKSNRTQLHGFTHRRVTAGADKRLTLYDQQQVVLCKRNGVTVVFNHFISFPRKR